MLLCSKAATFSVPLLLSNALSLTFILVFFLLIDRFFLCATKTKRYAGQQEILEYMRHVAQKHGLHKKIQFQTKITHVEWHQDLQKWVLDWTKTGTGETGQTKADVVFSGTGPLRVPVIPKQFEAFEGPKWHSAQWNHDYDLTNKRVAIVGSGAR